MAKKTSIIRKVYLYLVTTITIIILLIGFIGLLNLLLKEYVLDVKGWGEIERYWECEEPGGELMAKDIRVAEPVVEGEIIDDVMIDKKMTKEEKDNCVAEAKKQRNVQHMNDLKRDLAQYLAMILVALPLYLYHWGVIKKENEK